MAKPNIRGIVRAVIASDPKYLPDNCGYWSDDTKRERIVHNVATFIPGLDPKDYYYPHKMSDAIIAWRNKMDQYCERFKTKQMPHLEVDTFKLEMMMSVDSRLNWRKVDMSDDMSKFIVMGVPETAKANIRGTATIIVADFDDSFVGEVTQRKEVTLELATFFENLKTDDPHVVSDAIAACPGHSVFRKVPNSGNANDQIEGHQRS